MVRGVCYRLGVGFGYFGPEVGGFGWVYIRFWFDFLVAVVCLVVCIMWFG